MNTKNHLFSPLLIFTLIFSLFLNGCYSSAPPEKELAPTTAAPFSEASAENYEHFEEAQLKAQKEFEQQMEDLFISEISGRQIDLHFLLKDPSAYGITKAESPYGHFSLDSINESIEDQQSLKKSLETYDPALLTEQQRLTLRILQSILRIEDKSYGLELYSQLCLNSNGHC